MTFHVIIPARLSSSRLPEKVLLDIAGKPLLQYGYERALASGASSVVIATDDARVRAVANSFGAEVCMTRQDHLSGTDRLAEAVSQLRLEEDAIVVGLQADEPLIPSAIIYQVASNVMKNDKACMATLSAPLADKKDLFNPNVVKVVTDRAGYALYFTRAPIPWNRATAGAVESLQEYHRHIGLYAYRAGFLKRYVSWDPAPLELLESLEQLRVLWYGEKIHVAPAVELPGIGVDTQEDLECVRALISK